MWEGEGEVERVLEGSGGGEKNRLQKSVERVLRWKSWKSERGAEREKEKGRGEDTEVPWDEWTGERQREMQ